MHADDSESLSLDCEFVGGYDSIFILYLQVPRTMCDLCHYDSVCIIDAKWIF